MRKVVLAFVTLTCSLAFGQSTVLTMQNNGAVVGNQPTTGVINLLGGCSASLASTVSAFNVTCLPTVLAYLDQTGVSTANSGSAQNILASTPAAGQYRVSVYADESAGCTTVGSGVLTIVLGWTDATHARAGATLTLTPGTADTATTSFVSQTLPLWAASGSAITATATYTACSSGTWTYDLHASVERIE